MSKSLSHSSLLFYRIPMSNFFSESEIWGMSLFDNIEDEKTYMKEVAENQQITVIDAREKKKTLKAAMEEMVCLFSAMLNFPH